MTAGVAHSTLQWRDRGIRSQIQGIQGYFNIYVYTEYRFCHSVFFFFQAEDGIRDLTVTGVQTCALPISARQLLARRLPRAAAREHARHHRRRGGRGLGAPPRIDARRQLAPGAMQLEQGGPYLWRIPRDAERGMRGPGPGVADQRLIAPLRSDAALAQL